MVLTELASKLQGALSGLQSKPIVDEAAIDQALKLICNALLASDVNVKLVMQLRQQVKAKVAPTLGKSTSVKSVLQRAVFDELVALVDPTGQASTTAGPAPPVFKPVKNRTNVLMAVGLQGAGKTTSCSKLAAFYQRKGFKTCLVCADTFRAGAFDQLKQNAAKARVPFFGSYTETDPVVIARQGVDKFRKERFEVIIVDTSGRHRQEADLFDEMRQISAAVEPNLTIMVLDGAIGQAAESQSRAFKEAAGYGAMIVTKMDGHAKGGGAISAVAATKTPIAFIGVGEQMTDLERFDPRSFVSQLLGMGDMTGFMEQLKDAQAAAAPDGKAMTAEETRKKLLSGKFTLRDFKQQLETVNAMGPIGKLAGKMPGMGGLAAMMGGAQQDEATKAMRRIAYILDAMTPAELDSDAAKFLEPSGVKAPQGTARPPNPHILRLARGSGTSVDEVEQLFIQYRMAETMFKRAAGQKARQAIGPGGKPSAAQIQAMMANMPPQQRAQFQAMAAAGQLPDMRTLMGR